MDIAVAYTRAIEALFARTGGHIKPGLSRTEAMLLALGNPHRSFPAFHVAGTNGKGSVCATIYALLRSRGLRVGLYTSPHLVDFRERIVVDGEQISEAQVLDFLSRTERSAQLLQATFFEITTVMAFWHFAQQRVDVAVIETGLGGRYDSTNVIDPLVATVTNVTIDHTEYLGNTVEHIADEKGGIFKRGRGAVIGDPNSAVASRLAELAAARNASPIIVVRDDWRSSSVEQIGGMTRFIAATPYSVGAVRLATPLYGEHQADNTLTAIASVWLAGAPYWVPAEQLNDALSKVSIPGRFQRSGDWIFDVAHNPAGARVLAAALDTVKLTEPVTVLIGVLGDKDWRGILDVLAPVADAFIVTQPASAPADRAWNPMEASLYARRLGVPVQLEVDFDMAMLHARERGGTKVVTGSFHTVGDALQRLNRV
jgi:dihydrofolate synthase/folylpolyglutamate synthase